MKSLALNCFATLMAILFSVQLLAESMVWSRTAPVGEVCVEGDPCADELVMVASAPAPSVQGGVRKFRFPRVQSTRLKC